MSNIILLAMNAGFTIGRYHRIGEDYVSDSEGADITEQLESFYHAARAEALREAADRADASGIRRLYTEDLIGMANSEGKE